MSGTRYAAPLMVCRAFFSCGLGRVAFLADCEDGDVRWVGC